MTLLELAQLVCSRVNRTDAGALEAAKTYIKRRYEMIWNSRMWRDSVASGSASQFKFPQASEYSPFVVMPKEVDRVLCVWDTNANLPFSATELIDVARFNPSAFSEETGALSFVALPNIGFSAPIGYDNAEDYSVNLTFNTYNQEDDGKVVTIFGKSNGSNKSEEVVLSNNASSVNTWARIHRISKPVTQDRVVITGSYIEYPGDHVSSMDPAETYTCYAVIRLLTSMVPAPVGGNYYTVGFVAKMKCPAIIHDGDVMPLTGIENALDAYATGDMLFRERKAATAQLKWAEGAQLVESLAKEEKSASSGARVIPEGELVAGGRDWLGY